jgi:phosphoribosylaminoimidazole-succinocarboxamide synthase
MSMTPAREREEKSRAQLPFTLQRCESPEPSRRGKVRDLVERGDELFIVASDRVSAYDVILGTIPFKGALLTEQAVFWLERAKDVVQTHLIERPDPQVMRCHKAQPLAVEMVVRGFLAGSLMREPAESRGARYGLKLDPAIADYARLDAPIVTPTTKAELGEHDEPCAPAELVSRGVLSEAQLEEVTEKAQALFAMGSSYAAERGLLLVDTKYEFGVRDGRVVLIDEVHTADSSRYWVADSYEARLAAGEPPEMLDKERLRRWLRLERDYMGDGEPPPLPDDVRVDLACHYWDLCERVTGARFAGEVGDVASRIAATLGPLV